jgi:hypothetical protein
MEGFMRCIPSFAVMNATDREQAAAKEHLVAYLQEAGLTPANDPSVTACDSALSYLCSIPCRQDNDVIRYVHLFQYQDPFMTKPDYFHVTASADWWPENCRSLPPQHRTSGRAPLRLVS